MKKVVGIILILLLTGVLFVACEEREPIAIAKFQCIQNGNIFIINIYPGDDIYYKQATTPNWVDTFHGNELEKLSQGWRIGFWEVRDPLSGSTNVKLLSITNLLTHKTRVFSEIDGGWK